MREILLFVVVYLFYLFFWLIINLLAYFLSLVTKRPSIVGGMVAVSTVAVYILDFLIGIGLLWMMITLLLDGEIILFLVFLFFGAGLIMGALSYLQAPFALIPLYFLHKLEGKDFKEDIESAEILDKNGRVVGKIEGDTAVSVRLAKYFLAFFSLNLITLLISPKEDGPLPLNYLIIPFLQVIGWTFIFGIPYLIYHKIKHTTFFPDDRRYFFISVWRLILVIFVPFTVVVFILSWLTGIL